MLVGIWKRYPHIDGADQHRSIYSVAKIEQSWNDCVLPDEIESPPQRLFNNHGTVVPMAMATPAFAIMFYTEMPGMWDSGERGSGPGLSPTSQPKVEDPAGRLDSPALFIAISGISANPGVVGILPDYFRALGLESLLAVSNAGYLLVVVWICGQDGGSAVAIELLEAEILGLCNRHRIPLAPFYNTHDDWIETPAGARIDDCLATAETFRRAADDLGIDLHPSWVMGDRLDSMEAGRRAACRTILLDNGNESEWVLTAARTPHLIVEDMEIAAHAMIDANRRSSGSDRSGKR